jgi:hypothetical protein
LQEPHFDIEEAVRNIRNRARPRPLVTGGAAPPGEFPASLAPLDLSRSDVLGRELDSESANNGLPPVPPTWRGRLGLLIYKFFKRLLWWHTSRLSTVRHAAREQAGALQILSGVQRQQHAAMAALIEKVRKLEEQNRVLSRQIGRE